MKTSLAPSASGGQHGIFILLRRLRLPLSILILVYAVSVLGFTLVPGVDPRGEPWSMNFLHAFYFVSFLGTTIGLGEIPYPFSDAQRLWATGSIYATVLAWLYGIGALFSVLQDPIFRRVVEENRTERAVRRLRESFYLICGYDDAGSRVARELIQDGVQVVVIDKQLERVEMIDIEGLPSTVPALCADATDPQSLLRLGLTNPNCVGVLALTGDDFVNTKIALTAHLLNPPLTVLCSARDHLSQARMAAAGADHIINPFDTFAERIAMSIRTPSLHVIYEALTTQLGTAMQEPLAIPRGRWLLCGSGLFTRTLRRQLERLGIESLIIDAVPSASDESGVLVGDPTDSNVLRQAGIDTATVVVAGTSVDIDNLAIVLAARNLKKNLFTVARQTQRRNRSVFRAAPVDLVMLSGYVVAAEVLRVVRAPQLATFLRAARDEDEVWAAALLQKVRDAVGDRVVESWSIDVTTARASGLCGAISSGQKVLLSGLLVPPDKGSGPLHALPLMLQRGRTRHLLPPLDTALQLGDRVLFCGRERARDLMRRMVQTHHQRISAILGGADALTVTIKDSS